MYENLPIANNPSKTRKLTWLGALPDALRKESIIKSQDPELKASFGNLEAKSFWWRQGGYSSKAEFEKERCNKEHAKAKCYAAVSHFTKLILHRESKNPENLKPGFGSGFWAKTRVRVGFRVLPLM